MENIINELLAINYTNYYQLADYEEKAYRILNRLTRDQLIEIATAENICTVKKNDSLKDIKYKVYEDLVRIRCDMQVLGVVASCEGIFAIEKEIETYTEKGILGSVEVEQHKWNI